nr:hypothetical protein [Tanacetum cinerariifolium]
GFGSGVVTVGWQRWRWCRRWGERRVRESGVEGRIDRVMRKLFGFAGKIPPEKFSGGGMVAAAGGRPAVAAAGGGEWGENKKSGVDGDGGDSSGGGAGGGVNGEWGRVTWWVG